MTIFITLTSINLKAIVPLLQQTIFSILLYLLGWDLNPLQAGYSSNLLDHFSQLPIDPYLGFFEGEVLQHQDAFDLRVLDLLEKSLLVTEAQALGHVQVAVLHLAGQ